MAAAVGRMSVAVCECGMLAFAIIACLLFDIPIRWTLRLDNDCSSNYAEMI